MQLATTIQVLHILCIASRALSHDDAAEEQIAEMFEGDMILSPEQEMVIDGLARNALIGDKYRWPNKTVPYRIDIEQFNPEQIDLIREAMDTIESVSCIKFVEASQRANEYVKIVSERPGCFSHIGYHQGVQQINLASNNIGYGCFTLGTIMHELLHTLGFAHQQSVPDRDEYVQILWKNIKPKYKNNFKKYDLNMYTDFHVGYDYDSVMHYSRTAFSKNELPTILPIDPFVDIGQRHKLSEGDISKLNRLYNCKTKKD